MKEENTQNVPVTPVPVVQQKRELVLEGDPEQQLAFAKKAATALMKVVKPVKIAQKDYLQFGGWQTLGRFFGATVGVEWSKRIEEGNGKLLGYEARAVVHQHGEVISSAEAVCMKTERRWGSADEYAIKSMAQTRASAKALRNAFGWVAELAGLESTPAEEMDGVVVRQSASVPTDVEAKVKNASTEEELKAIWTAHKGLGKEFARLVTEQRDFIRSVKASEKGERVIEA